MTNHTIRKAQTEIRRFAGRARRVADVPGMVRHLHFQRLRERFNSEMWQTAAQAIGAEFAPWRSGFSRVSRDGRMTLVRGGEVMLDSHLTLDLMGNKSLVYALMREKGFPSPAHIRFSAANLAPAERFLEEASGPIVVKPESGTGGGRGVTTGITDVHALRKAVRLAARYDVGLIAEDQFEGSSYRLLFLDGRFIDAVRRDPPQAMRNRDGRRIGFERHRAPQCAQQHQRMADIKPQPAGSFGGQHPDPALGRRRAPGLAIQRLPRVPQPAHPFDAVAAFAEGRHAVGDHLFVMREYRHQPRPPPSPRTRVASSERWISLLPP